LAYRAPAQGLDRPVLVHMGERPFNTPDGIEAPPVVHFTEELLAGRF
jgi:hypothetical protein